MIPLATATFTVERPTGDRDPYEEAYLDEAFTIRGVVASPTGRDRQAGGAQEIIDAALVVDPSPRLQIGDRLSDGTNCWVVAWVQHRPGVGLLEHQRCGVRRVTGAANGR